MWLRNFRTILVQIRILRNQEIQGNVRNKNVRNRNVLPKIIKMDFDVLKLNNHIGT